MKFVFQRPIWLDFTAFSLALMGISGHVLGLLRLVWILGINLKIEALEFAIKIFSYVFDYNSWLILGLRETLFIFLNFLTLPKWFRFWYSFSGFLELVVSTALIVVGVLLWNKKTYAVKAFYIFIILSIGIHLFAILSSLLVSDSLSLMKILLDVPFLLLKLCLIPLVYFADKSMLGTHAKSKVNFSYMGYSQKK